MRQHLTQARPDIRSLGAEAAVRAERGEIDEAERLFVKAQQQYRDVSPFPVVWLYFQQSLMWMWEGNLERARAAFEAACPGCQGMRRCRGTSP
jgi:ATP/maltotriose-dependent transcriptional regulator MalT